MGVAELQLAERDRELKRAIEEINDLRAKLVAREKILSTRLLAQYLMARISVRVSSDEP